MFADLNRYAIRPSKSIGVLYDHRDDLSAITRMALFQMPVLRSLTEMEGATLSSRSRKLFTLSGIYTATRALLDGIAEEAMEPLVALTVAYWSAIVPQFPDWLLVRQNVVAAGEIRNDFLHSHGIVIHALGKIGNTLVHKSRDPEHWSPNLNRLSDINWSRDNAELWEGRAMIGGRVSKNSANLLLTTAAIRKLIGLPPTPEEQRFEDAFQRGES
jgi:DNA sulfur modification protein DndB